MTTEQHNPAGFYKYNAYPRIWLLPPTFSILDLLVSRVNEPRGNGRNFFVCTHGDSSHFVASVDNDYIWPVVGLLKL